MHLAVICAAFFTLICNHGSEGLTKKGNKIVTLPQNKTVMVGEPVQFSVRNSESSSMCIWTVPPVDNVGNLGFLTPVPGKPPGPYPNSEGRKLRPENQWSFEWYGEDQTRDCGISIPKTVRYDGGQWSFTVGGDDNSGIVFIYVKAPPLKIEFKNFGAGSPPANQDFGSGKVTFNLTDFNEDYSLNVSCVSTGSRPRAALTWLIDDEPIYPLNSSNHFVIEERNPDESFDVTEILLFTPKPMHDGKKLRCVYSHEAYSNQDLVAKANEISVNLVVFSIPDPIAFTYGFEDGTQGYYGENSVFAITFHSNPAPLQFEWRVPEISTPLTLTGSSSKAKSSQDTNGSGGNSATYGRYQVHDLVRVNGGATYVAKLTVADLQEGDLGKKLTLKVRNEVGSTEYNVALNMLESGKLKGAAVAGIVVGVLVIIGLGAFIALMAFKKSKQRKSKDKVKRQNKRANEASNTSQQVMPVAVRHRVDREDDIRFEGGHRNMGATFEDGMVEQSLESDPPSPHELGRAPPMDGNQPI